MGDRQDLLINLPTELLRFTLFGYISEDLYTCAELAKHPQFFKLPEYKQAADTYYASLVQPVVNGDQREAKKIILKSPELLLIKAKVIDYSGRTIEGTPFQIALGANDEEMCEMIMKYLDQAEQLKQCQEQFPTGYEAEEKKRATNDSVAFQKIIKAISTSQNNSDDALVDALSAFRDYLKPNGVIKTGKHFNPELLTTAFKFYVKKYDNLDQRKKDFIWCKVIGLIQRYLPASYAQAFCEGTWDREVVRSRLTRNLKFRDNVGFFPLDSDIMFRLGYDFAARPGAACADETGIVPGGGIEGCGWSYSSFYKVSARKTSALKNIMQQTGLSRGFCIVM